MYRYIYYANKQYSDPGLNWGPSPRQGDVITTTPSEHTINIIYIDCKLLWKFELNFSFAWNIYIMQIQV